MDNSNDQIKVTTLSNGMVQLSLNRPNQLNALSHALLTHLQQLLTAIKNDKTIRGVLLTGEGKGFCAGADISELKPLQGKDGFQFAEYGQQVMRQLEMLGKPSIAAIHGFAFGGGCELAMAATLRLAAEKTQFGQPEIKLGVIPGFGGTQRLSRLIGKGRALDICLSGRRFSAEEAWQWGLVNEVVSSDQLIARATERLQELVQVSPVAVQSILTTINPGYDIPLEDAFALEASHFGLCCTTKDKQEGVSAFLEKRIAQFSGE